MKEKLRIRLIRILIALAIPLITYFFVYRPIQMNWGAGKNEITRTMPGDEIVSRPQFSGTRAVTIHASPEQIFPWMVQLGIRRGGWYSYDLIDNLLRKSADRIIPALQNLKPGDLIPMNPDTTMGFFVREIHPPFHMVWWEKADTLQWTWALYPVDNTRTRLITRIRWRYNWFSPWVPFYIMMDAGDFIMMRQCMLGIRDRAEGKRPKSVLYLTIELLCWIAVFVLFVIADIRILRKKFRLVPTAFLSLGLSLLTIGLVFLHPPLWITLTVTAAIFYGFLNSKKYISGTSPD